MWLSDQLCSKYRHDDMECPVTVNQYTQQIFDLVRESHLAWRFILEKVQSWDQIESGNELAELDLITKFLDFYELSVYYDVDKMFLKFEVLKSLAPKITSELLDEMQAAIGNDVDEDFCLTEWNCRGSTTLRHRFLVHIVYEYSHVSYYAVL